MPQPRIILIATALLGFSFTERPCAAQQIIKGDSPTCIECSIATTLVVRLGGTGPGVGWPSSLVRGSQGQYLLANLSRQTEIDEYDPSGVYRRSFGSFGDGPGRFKLIRHLLLDRGRLEVFDIAARRRTSLTEELEVLDVYQFGIPAEALVKLSSNRWFVNANVPLPDHVGMPLHLVDSTGTITRSFGGNGYYRRDAAFLLRERLGTSGDEGSHVWSAAQHDYRIREWSQTGELLHEYVRTPSWFPSGTMRRYRRDVQPAPMIEAVQPAENGLLWVVATVPDERWREQYADRDDDRAFNGDFGRLLDSVLELIDPQLGEVVAQLRLDAFVRGFLDAKHIYTYHLAEDGVPFVDVLRLDYVDSRENR